MAHWHEQPWEGPLKFGPLSEVSMKRIAKEYWPIIPVFVVWSFVVGQYDQLGVFGLFGLFI